jgi:hypothetical protein
VDNLLWTDLPVAHRDFKVLAGNHGEPITKKNIFGWTVLGNLEKNSTPGIFAVETIDDITKDQDIKKLIFQDQLRIKPTRYCTCSEKEMRECAFIRHVDELPCARCLIQFRQTKECFVAPQLAPERLVRPNIYKT